MKIGYIVLAHQKPAQLLRLLKAIESDETKIFLHIDKKVDLTSFTNQPGFNEVKNLQLLPRYKSYWGSFGLVKATMAGIDEGLKANVDYIILLSGSDYPIKSKAAIHQFLEINNGKSFFDHYRMPAPHWLPNKEINRIKKYYFHLNGKLFEYPMNGNGGGLPRKLINTALKFVLPRERVFPKNIVPYGGDQWFCITAEAARTVLQFYDKHPSVYRFLKNCLIPDEIFLQTAMLNIQQDHINENIVNSCLTFLNWQNKATPSPAVLTINDFGRLQQSDKLFARKFDHDLHPQLIEKIDAHLLS